MKEMIRRYLRQKFGSIGIVIALAIFALIGSAQTAATGRAEALESGGFFALLALAAASVSKDASSGALQMILARPIRRVDYLFGRYCGILLAYAAYLAATAGLALLLSPLLGKLLNAENAGKLSPGDLVLGATGSLLSSALFAAVLLFFSTFLRGYGDVLSYFLLSLLLAAPGVLARPLKMPWLDTLGTMARENILPRVSWDEVLRGRGVLSPATGEYVLAVTAYLAFAALVFSRREFTYGHD
jgi:ABC-type transport system involved in multi-copper enzyme maturation permease subunit